MPLLTRYGMLVQCMSRQYHRTWGSVTCLATQTATHCIIPTRGMFNNKKAVSRKFLATIQQEIDLRPVAISRWGRKAEWDALVKYHSYIPERASFLGEDLAIAHFVLPRGGAVRFCGIDHWFEAASDNRVPDTIPNFRVDHYQVEAVDASGTPIMYCSFDNIPPVRTLRYMNLSECPNIDDWCLDRLHLYRDCLQYLDLSGCPKVTERGLATLHKLRSLKRLKLENMEGVRDKPIVSLLLEESLPGCAIEGMDYAKPEQVADDATRTETFEDYERHLLAAIQADIEGEYYDPKKH